MKHLLRKVLYGLLGRGNSILNKLVFSLQKNDNNVVVFNTAISTDNLGDYIIMHSIKITTNFICLIKNTALLISIFGWKVVLLYVIL